MENSVLTDLLVQAHVREILSQAERDRLASKAPSSARRIDEVLISRLTRLWRTTQPRSLAMRSHRAAAR